jgi:ubiquinone/menaquinone biosynthesis C-methylase UbiE
MADVKDKSIKDTGERMVPAYHRGHVVYGEHIVRYQAALPIVKDKVILDIASGSGYGTALLGEAASKAYGVDVDKDAIRYAKKNYSSKKVEFLEGDGQAIPLEDSSVDVVVTFETIEHIEDYESFMDEVARVLKKDGLLILSTPNDKEFPESNHFHIHEFEMNELESLAKKHFKNIKSYYQGTWVYSALFDEKGLSKDWEGAVHTMQTAPIEPDKCIYFYLLCSNRKITENASSLGAIAEHFSERKRQEYELSVKKHMDDQAAIIKHLENTARDSGNKVEELQNELKAIHNSKPWKVAKKLQSIKTKAKR